jgi:hypothetical protein
MPFVKRSTDPFRLVFATCEENSSETPIAMPSTANSSCVSRARIRTRYRRAMLESLITSLPRAAQLALTGVRPLSGS